MGKPLRVLIVEDSEDDALLTVRELKHGGYEPAWERVDTAKGISTALSKQTWDVIIADYRMPNFSASAALKLMQESGLDLPIIIVSGTIGENTAVEAMRSGAHDYMMKGNLKRLVPAIERELYETRVRKKRKQAEESLRESEERQRAVLQSAKDAIVSIDSSGSIISWNKGAQVIFGYTVEEAIGKSISILMPEQFRDSFKSAMKHSSIQEWPYFAGKTNEFLGLRKDGSEFPAEVSLASWKAEQGIFHTSIVRDITERRQAENGIRKAAEEWRTTFDAISDLISIHDSNYKITRVNRAFAKVFGMEPKEVIGKTCYEVVHGKSEPPLHCPHKRALETGKPETVEFFEPNLGIYLEVSVSPVFNEKGKVVRIVHIAKDITERKKMEEELRESEERYRALLRLGGKVGEAIVMLQDTNLGEGIQVFANNEWSDITGYSEEELQAMSFFSLLHPRHRKASVERHRRKISGEDIPSLFVMSIIRKDGTEVPVELTSAYTTYKGERANVAYIRDITERNKMEEQLIVTDRLASVGELVSGVAHEVNNPLTSIVGFSELLLAANVPDAVKEDLKVINREAQRASGIVRNLLTFARRHNPEKQMVDVNDTIQAVLDLRTYEEKVNNIMAIKYFASDLPKITADGFQLRQVFLNLIINAEYFMIESHGKGTLSIKTERDRDIIRISFTDDGPGILEENAKHLFDPFFTTKEVGKGTGLGLSICHGIITEHGGRIYAKSGLGKGATFVVELPIRQQ